MKFAIILFFATSAAFAQQSSRQKIRIPAKTSQDTNVISVSSQRPDSQKEKIQSDSLSSFNYFPSQGTKSFTFTPTFRTFNSSNDFANSKESREGNGVVTKIDYQNRLSQKLALEVKNDFGSEDTKVVSRSKITNSAADKADSKQAGLGDFHITLKAIKAETNTVFIGGADLGLSPTSREEGTSRYDGNRYSGGSSITPFVTFEKDLGARILGFKGSLSLFADRSIEKKASQVGASTQRITQTGGQTASILGFNEWRIKKSIVGVNAKIDFIGQGTYEPSGEKATNIDPSQLLTASLYGNFKISNQTSILPALSFQTLMARGSSTLDAYDDLSLGIAARFGL